MVLPSLVEAFLLQKRDAVPGPVQLCPACLVGMVAQVQAAAASFKAVFGPVGWDSPVEIYFFQRGIPGKSLCADGIGIAWDVDGAQAGAAPERPFADGGNTVRDEKGGKPGASRKYLFFQIR